MRCAVYLMVGPGEVEAQRLKTVLRSLFRHEPNTPIVVVVNDTGGKLPSVEGIVPAGCSFIEVSKTRRPSVHEHSWNILAALRLLAARDDYDFAVKLDTDALVIAPFVNQIGRYLQDHPDVGQVGSAERDVHGNHVTDFGVYTRFARRLKRRIQIWRSPAWGVAQAFFGDFALVRRLMLRAAANGVDNGLHCQGGAYAISKAAINRLSRDGLLVEEPLSRIFGLADDLMIPVLVAAVGYKLASMTAPGEPFAVTPIGLPLPPDELLAKGYALIHSIKNDKRMTEPQLVAYFDRAAGA